MSRDHKGYDIEEVRAAFPSLAVLDSGNPRIYFDNPGGTQVPARVIERMNDCLINANANLGGYFTTSKLADAVADDAHAAMADFLNAASPDEIIFGQNMTTITFHVSRSIGRTLTAGDEIVLSQMDHDANVQPWVLLAKDLDLKVRWLPFDTGTYEFDLAALDELLTSRTRLICVGGASNLTGTLNNVTEICRRARKAGVWSYIDAVQSAPHVITDVQAIGCDFLALSAYKFFGPHQGILWGRRDVLESLDPYKIRPAPDELPWCFEPGTQSHEGMAGTAAAIDHFNWIGETMATQWRQQHIGFTDRRRNLRAAMDCLFDYEKQLTVQLITGLQSLRGVTVHGITDADALDRRVPTVSFTHDRHAPGYIAKALAKLNIFVWSGHNYAIEPTRALGLLDSGGVVRVGAVHYNTPDEIDSLLNALDETLT
ncbi:MAG: cysteine desulfurase-like protein [Woeseiaceae bacterium]|nr:cysteine desulfurase-like protein [Woeseiaceae bacterium]